MFTFQQGSKLYSLAKGFAARKIKEIIKMTAIIIYIEVFFFIKKIKEVDSNVIIMIDKNQLMFYGVLE